MKLYRFKKNERYLSDKLYVVNVYEVKKEGEWYRLNSYESIHEREIDQFNFAEKSMYRLKNDPKLFLKKLVMHIDFDIYSKSMDIRLMQGDIEKINKELKKYESD